MALAVPSASSQLEELLQRARQYLPPARLESIEHAYAFAERAHEGQLRKSGEPYITHPLAVASLIAELQLDAAAVSAALLHDVQEDCGVANSKLSEEFGAEVGRLVEGLTKVSQINYEVPAERAGAGNPQAENLRKMFLAMAQDVRVVIIKLADRVHNMRTLDAMPEPDRIRIARETMDVFAPLASRLGIWQFKWELEDLAFRHLEPARFHEVASLVAAKRAYREKYITQVEAVVREELRKVGVKAEVYGRAKHIYSIASKMDRYTAQGRSFNEIYDLMALRVLCETVGDCYHALGVIHGLWRPIPASFDDYIANPKENGYQSLHTAVMALNAQPLEVQIRSRDMHDTSEYGVAAHWRYKEGSARDQRMQERMAWLRRLVEWHQDISGAEEFVETIKSDIFQDQVFAYTPKGELKDLPAGSTPIDFAYRVHTDIGHRCIGAKVSGRLVPLNYHLQNGDIVEIITAKSASRGPSLDWLNPNLGYAKTSHAKEKIRAWFKRQKRGENIERGREILDKELRRLSLTLADSKEDILRFFGYEQLDDFLAAVGYGGISASLIGIKLAALIPAPEPEPAPVETPTQKPIYTANIQVLGTGDLLTQLARCCNPVPGDPIIGYITRSRGVTVHRTDCQNAAQSEQERVVDVEWGHSSQLYPVSVRIDSYDRVGLMRDIGAIVAEERTNMAGIRTVEHGDSTVSVHLTLQTAGVEHLTRLLSRLEAIKGVTAVTRATESAKVKREAARAEPTYRRSVGEP
ncbi:MAG: bifunctional (p)ppGpp synthetase/guanosine-3',5'-bis(diphosphate) 3'-pyrophosphohydrolase [Dehalococcoidia bacterium]